jgi:hypothetical protein
MGIKVEFNPDLALRSIAEFKAGRRKKEECVPARLALGKMYPFLKSGQRLYNIGSKTPLLVTKGNENLSEPVAAIRILEVRHILKGKEIFTEGTYIVDRVLDNGWVGFGGYGK